jgi:hypothetical protein
MAATLGAFAAACVHVEAAEPRGLLGTWIEPTAVCYQVADPKRDRWVDSCQPHKNVLRLVRDRNEPGAITVTFGRTMSRGHSCEFEGVGHWNETDRVQVRNATTGCELVLVYTGSRIHTVVTTEEQCRTHCGFNASLNGSVLQKTR